MAYLASKRNALVSDSGAPAVASAVAPSSSPAAPTDTKGGAGGAMQDFREYLSANADQSKALVDRLTAPLDASAASAAPQIKGYGNSGQIYGSSAETNAQIAARNTAAQAAQDKLNAYAGEGGLSQLLSDTAAQGGTPYTPGMASMDAYLVGGAGGNERLQALRDRWSGLLGQQESVAGDLATRAGPGLIAGTGPAQGTVPAKASAPPKPIDEVQRSPAGKNPGQSPGPGWTWHEDHWVWTGGR